MVENERGFRSATTSPGCFSTLACQLGAPERTRMFPCFAHVADVINNTVAAPKATKHQGKLVTDSDNKRVGEFEADMDNKSLKHGSVEFRGKEQRRIKLELKAKPGAANLTCYESDVRIDTCDSTVIEKVCASIEVGGGKKSDKPGSICTGLKRVGVDRFGLWSEVKTPNKVVFKWLPIQSDGTGAKIELKGGEFTFKDASDRESINLETPAKPVKQPQGSGAGKNHSEELKNFLCGGFAGVVSRTAVAPLDLIKTHLITSHGMHGYHKTAMQIFFEIWNADGWRGLFRGNGVNCIRVAPCKAIELCVFEIVKKIMSKEGSPFHRIAAPVAGGAAGMAGTLATYPLELIRTRISLQPHKYRGAVEAIMKVINEEGFLALYAGLTPSLLGVFPYAATNYCVYDGLRSGYRRATGKRHVPTGLTLLFGALAAAASSAVTYPLEVARRQMQLGTAALVARNSTLDVVKQIYAEEGFLALYRGLGTTWLKLVPAAGISFVCYEAARRAWEHEEQRIVQRRNRKKR